MDKESVFVPNDKGVPPAVFASCSQGIPDAFRGLGIQAAKLTETTDAEDVLYRLTSKADGGLGNLDKAAIQPKVIVLMIGTNNLFPPHSAKQISGGIEAVAKRLRELRPDATLVISSILPSHSPAKNKQQIIPANKNFLHWLSFWATKFVSWTCTLRFLMSKARKTKSSMSMVSTSMRKAMKCGIIN